MNASRHAIIIGAGLSGLSCAILLAEHGWRVTLLEKHHAPGGLMQRYRRGGLWFDTGFHLASGGGPGGVLRAILHRLGLQDRVRFLDPDPVAQFVVATADGESLSLPVGIQPAAEVMVARWPAQTEALRAFFAAIRGGLAANPWLFPLADGAVPQASTADLSVDQMLEACGVSGQPQRLLGALSSILAMQPATCPFPLYVSFAGSSLSGAWRVADGGDGLVQPLVARCAALGVTLHCGCPATAIRHDGRTVAAVVDGQGRKHGADLAITAIHPAAVLDLTGPDGFRPHFQSTLADTPDGDGAFLLAAELDRSAVELGSSHHFLRLSDGGNAYLVAPDRWDPALPPCLEALLWIPADAVAAWRSSTVGRRPADYAAWKRKQEERLLTGIRSRFPGLAEAIRRTWTASPLTFRDYTGSRFGGAMGMSHDIGHLGTQPLSPRNKLRNLLLTGQNLHPPGILGSLIGGCVTAGAILGRDIAGETLDPAAR